MKWFSFILRAFAFFWSAPSLRLQNGAKVVLVVEPKGDNRLFVRYPEPPSQPLLPRPIFFQHIPRHRYRIFCLNPYLVNAVLTAKYNSPTSFVVVHRFGWADGADLSDPTGWIHGLIDRQTDHSIDQIEDALRSINEQLRDAKDGRRMTKHQEKMADCLVVSFRPTVGLDQLVYAVAVARRVR